MGLGSEGRQLREAIWDLLADLKPCSIVRDLHWGRVIHAKSTEAENESNLSVVRALIRMYVKCRNLVEAHGVFESVQNPGVVSWNVLLMGYAENGNGLVALTLFRKMKTQCQPDSATYVAALKACLSLAVKHDLNALQWGREIHSKVGYHLNHYVQNSLIHLYAKSGSMVEARQVFDSIKNPDVVAWTALLLGYAENGEGLTTLDLFSKMKAEKCFPNSVTYVAALKACATLATNGDEEAKSCWLLKGKELHSQIGCHLDHYVQNTLIDMYAKCGSIDDALDVFNSIENPDVVSWNCLLMGYATIGKGLAALSLFSKMKASGCKPNAVTYLAILKTCTYIAAQESPKRNRFVLERVREIHSKMDFPLDHQVQNALIDVYAKCGNMLESRCIFDGIEKPTVVCWTSLILGYAENGDGLVALEIFTRMKVEKCVPNFVTYVAALKACISLALRGDKSCLERGKIIHVEIGTHSDRYVQNTLIDMYSKCGSMVEARQVFDTIRSPDVVCWTVLIMGYADNGDGRAALDLFSCMKSHGCSPNSVTYVAAIKSCISLGKAECLNRGKDLHLQIGLCLDRYVQSMLIDMYAKCGSLVDARETFDSIRSPDAVSWTALLLGYVEAGHGLAALELFSKMRASGCTPDPLTYVAVLKACGLLGALSLGRKFHLEITEFPANVVTCLVDFYAKCGSLNEAHEVFDLHSKTRDASTWTALLAGYATFDCTSVFDLFKGMQDEGLRPDDITFVCLLMCCSHAGLVEKAMEYFEAMPSHYGVTPTVMHFSCMADILGRANQLNEAIAMLRKMSCNPDTVTWRALLDACRKWKNAEIGRLAFQSLIDMDKKDASAYVLVAHIYGSKGMWEEEKDVMEMAGVYL